MTEREFVQQIEAAGFKPPDPWTRGIFVRDKEAVITTRNKAKVYGSDEWVDFDVALRVLNIHKPVRVREHPLVAEYLVTVEASSQVTSDEDVRRVGAVTDAIVGGVEGLAGALPVGYSIRCDRLALGKSCAVRDRAKERRDYVTNCALRLVDASGENVLERLLAEMPDFPEKTPYAVVWRGKHYRISAQVPTGVVEGASHGLGYEIVGCEITEDDPLHDYEREEPPYEVRE